VPTPTRQRDPPSVVQCHLPIHRIWSGCLSRFRPLWFGIAQFTSASLVSGVVRWWLPDRRPTLGFYQGLDLQVFLGLPRQRSSTLNDTPRESLSTPPIASFVSYTLSLLIIGVSSWANVFLTYSSIAVLHMTDFSIWTILLNLTGSGVFNVDSCPPYVYSSAPSTTVVERPITVVHRPPYHHDSRRHRPPRFVCSQALRSRTTIIEFFPRNFCRPRVY
jgi:hypothetical protein